MFDNTPSSPTRAPRASPADARPGPEDERIALRCNQRELQLLDTFVASGEFRSRSELMRFALREFLRDRASTAAGLRAADDTVAVSVRLRRDEAAVIAAYGESVANGIPLDAVLAQLVRSGARDLHIRELVEDARRSIQLSAATREVLESLDASARSLARRGVIGR
ncbi:MAG: ribbon-helix-helix domain-containing protein [Thermoplasmata archaeon]|nr:ribbon-helix-helix domain-containing protein [Thermoplasmata archaeon]